MVSRQQWVCWNDDAQDVSCHVVSPGYTELIGMKAVGKCRALSIITLTSHEHNDVSNHQLLECWFNSLYRLTCKKISKPSVNLSLMEGYHRWSVDSPHKGPVTREVLICHDIYPEQVSNEVLIYTCLSLDIKVNVTIWQSVSTSQWLPHQMELITEQTKEPSDVWITNTAEYIINTVILLDSIRCGQ